MSDWVAQIGEVTNVQQQTATITIQVNPEFASHVTRRIKPYQRLPQTMRPALQRVADYVKIEMIPRTFNQEGPGWRPLSRRTQAERASQGYNPKHPMLIRTKDLFRELTEKGHAHHIEIIKTGKNARVEVGGSSTKFYRNQGGNWMLHIPPRPMIPGTGYVPLPDKDKREIKKILEDGIMQAVRKS